MVTVTGLGVDLNYTRHNFHLPTFFTTLRLSLVNAKRERFKLTTRSAGMRCQALLSEYEEDEAGRRGGGVLKQTYGCWTKNSGVSPQIIHFNRGFPWNKPPILGVFPLFLERPISETEGYHIWIKGCAVEQINVWIYLDPPRVSNFSPKRSVLGV